MLREGLLKVTLNSWSEHQYILPASVQEVVWSGYARITHPSTLQHLFLKYSWNEIDLSHMKVHRLTIGDRRIRIQKLPPGLRELEFTDDDLQYTLRVPQGCVIVGEKQPTNVIME